MATVHASIFNLLNLNPTSSDDEIEAVVSGMDLSSGAPIFSEEGRACLKSCLLTNNVGEIARQEIAHGSDDWRYVKIEDQSTIVAEICFCPNGLIADLNTPSTSAEILLVKAWAGGLLTFDVPLIKCAITIVDKSSNIISSDVIQTISGIADYALLDPIGANYKSILGDVATIHLSSTFSSKEFLDLYAGLLRDAIQQTVPKWRFLQLYRILERGYISKILGQIVRDFTASPKTALKAAQTSLESEPSQLKNLIEVSGIINEFESIVDTLDNLLMQNNKFAWALDHKISQKGSGGVKFRKGADIVYAIRCAIAHAGSLDIFYENYSDADVCIKGLLPSLELAVLLFLGVIAV